MHGHMNVKFKYLFVLIANIYDKVKKRAVYNWYCGLQHCFNPFKTIQDN
jgi:hypothetical protein